MSEPRSGDRPDTRPDAELDVKTMSWFLVGLAGVIVVAAVLMWSSSKLLRGWEVSNDPPAPAMAEARAAFEPPAPRLQDDPFEDIVALEAHEAEVLATYAWVDREVGIVRVPIERAMALTVEEGER